MLTKSSRRGTGRLLAVLTVLLGLTGVAQAQQSGLFPLHPIQRERVPCSMEDPVYKLYRSQYYGYFPTQWRPFPQGWNMPSPEGPNTQQALLKQPIEATEPPPEEPGADEEGMAPPEPGQRQAPMPPPENERSPFDMDRPDNGGAAAPGAGAAPRRPQTRGNVPDANERSPFEMPEDATTPAPRPRAPQPNRPAPNTPDLSAPDPVPTAPPRTSRNDQSESDNRDNAPLLAMPDATLPPVEEVNGLRDGAPAPSPTFPTLNIPVADGHAPPPPAVAAQPSRRGRLSSLFSGLGLNRVRR